MTIEFYFKVLNEIIDFKTRRYPLQLETFENLLQKNTYFVAGKVCE